MAGYSSKLILPFYYINRKPDMQFIGYEEYKESIGKSRADDGQEVQPVGD